MVFFRGKYRWNEANVHAPFSSVNPSIIIFFYFQQIYQWTKNYRRKIQQQSIYVSDFVGKLITNKMIVQIPTENSIDKYKDCDSELAITLATYKPP
jgi:hypothetical protein